MVVGRQVLEPGWRWSEIVRPIAGTDLCEHHHIGVTISGSVHVQMRDGGELEFGPDTVYEIPPGHDAWVTGTEPYVSLDFSGMRGFALAPDAPGERVLATILFTDVVDSTATAERLGDARWRTDPRRSGRRVRLKLAAFRGREIKDTGDGFLAIFDGTARAVRCAAAIRDCGRRPRDPDPRGHPHGRGRDRARTTSVASPSTRRHGSWRSPSPARSSSRDDLRIAGWIGTRVRGSREPRAQGVDGRSIRVFARHLAGRPRLTPQSRDRSVAPVAPRVDDRLELRAGTSASSRSTTLKTREVSPSRRAAGS